MASIKNVSKLTVLGLVAVLGFSASANADSRSEALWRVEADQPASAVPEYANGESPFPQRAMPETKSGKKVEPQADLLHQEMMFASARAQKAGTVLQAIREMIAADLIYAPDVSTVKVNGRIARNGESKVLIRNIWSGIDGIVTVSAKGTRDVLVLLEQLDALDKSLADVVRQDVEDRIATARPLTLKITEITADQVTLKDEWNGNYTLDIAKSGW